MECLACLPGAAAVVAAVLGVAGSGAAWGGRCRRLAQAVSRAVSRAVSQAAVSQAVGFVRAVSAAEVYPWRC